jgi:hypothetical protein
METLDIGPLKVEPPHRSVMSGANRHVAWRFIAGKENLKWPVAK